MHLAVDSFELFRGINPVLGNVVILGWGLACGLILVRISRRLTARLIGRMVLVIVGLLFCVVGVQAIREHRYFQYNEKNELEFVPGFISLGIVLILKAFFWSEAEPPTSSSEQPGDSESDTAEANEAPEEKSRNERAQSAHIFGLPPWWRR
jgi:hypothetical protein